MLKPVHDFIAVVPQVEERTSKIIMINESNEAPSIGYIHSKGEGRILDNGQRIPIALEVGQKIIFSKYAGVSVSYGDDEILLIREMDVLAILED